ncbi:YcbK family protein [Roseicella aquatilis]|nr:DUF882 domain-containing protein [Roseicella aquatilis]
MRRRFLLLAAPALVSLPARAAPRRPVVQPRRLALRHVATGAGFSGPWHDGAAPDLSAMTELSQVLADTRTGEVRPFDPLAIEVLWEVARRAGITGTIPVLSGYRTMQTNAEVGGAVNSQHLRAGAVDVALTPAQMPGFAEQALLLGRGGVGVYATRSFVHLDSGPVRRWGDIPEDLTLPPATATASLRTLPRLGFGGGRRLNLTFDPVARLAEAWAQTRVR